MKEPTIITVATMEKDTYGNLNIVDTSGNKVRINKKHESLHPIFEVGGAYELSWDEYKGIDFVANAKRVSEPPSDLTKSKSSPTEEKVRGNLPSNGKNRAFALSYSKDIAVAFIGQGKDVSKEKVVEIAKFFEEYLDGK